MSYVADTACFRLHAILCKACEFDGRRHATARRGVAEVYAGARALPSTKEA